MLVIFVICFIFIFWIAYVLSVCCISGHTYRSNWAKKRLIKWIAAIFSVFLCILPFLCLSIFYGPHEWNRTQDIKPIHLWLSLGWLFSIIFIAAWLNKKEK